MTERRRHARSVPAEYLTVYDDGTGEKLGGIANLSDGGLMLITEHKIHKGAKFRCRVGLARPIMGYTEVIFDVDCLWSRKNVEAGWWESGYVTEATGIDDELLSYLVLGYKMKQLGQDDSPDISIVELENLRESVRYGFEIDLPVYEQDSYRQLGWVRDLSTRGMNLESRKEIRPGSLLSVRVRLPRPIFQKDYLQFTAESLWCRKQELTKTYRSGFRLMKIERVDTAIILHLLLHYGKEPIRKKRMLVTRK